MFLQNIQKGSREENQRSVWESDALIKFTDGESKDLIKHCIHLKPESRRNREVHCIRRRYGKEPFWSDISGFTNEEEILVTDPVFLRKVV